MIAERKSKINADALIAERKTKINADALIAERKTEINADALIAERKNKDTKGDGQGTSAAQTSVNNSVLFDSFSFFK